jgi:two-component system, cell cycle response regulator DivK
MTAPRLAERHASDLDNRIGTAHPAEPLTDRKPSAMSEPKTVLLVEDNEDNRIVYATMLEHYGYKVVETANGEDAVRIAREQKPDLILMDISIPGIDGWTATERIRENPDTAEIPVVAVTAHALPEHRARAESLHCEGYLTKPCEPRRLLEEVQRLIG